MISTEKRVQFQALLQQEHQYSEDMLGLLNEEYELLKDRKFESLEGLIQKKQEIASDLEKHENRIFQFCSQLGYQPTAVGIKEIMDSLDHIKDSETISIWQQIKISIKHCKHQNQVNGRIVNISMISNQHLQNILHGRDVAPGLYNNEGKADEADDNQSIAIA